MQRAGGRTRDRPCGLGGGGHGGNSAPVVPAYQSNFAQATPDALGDFTLSSPANATYADSAGNLAYSVANTPRYEYYGTTPAGIKKEAGSTNLCTNFNAAPTTAGLTASGTGTAGGVSIVADPASYLNTAINEYGFPVNLRTYVCTAGNLIKLDNSTGGAPATLAFAGPPTSGGTYTGSVYVRTPAGSFLSCGTTTATISSPTVLTRLAIKNFIASDSTSTLTLTVPAGGIAYAILNQLEGGPISSSVIVTAGAATGRNNDVMYRNLTGGETYINQQAGAMILECDLDEPTYQQLSFIVFQNGSTGTLYNANNMSCSTLGTRPRVKNTTKANSVSPAIQVGNNVGNTTVDISSMDVANKPYFAGFTWNQGTQFVAIHGALDTTICNLGTFSQTLNRIDIMQKANNANYGNGHVRGLQIYNLQPSVPQVGANCNFANWAIAAKDGQSNNIYPCGNDAANSGALNGFNNGERAGLAILQALLPAKRVAFAHVAEGGASYCTANPDGKNSFYLAATSTPQADWYRAADIISGLLAGGAIFLYIDSNQGETDITNSAADQINGFTFVESGVRTLVGTKTITGSLMPIIKEPIGRRGDSSANDVPTQIMRELQRTYGSGANGPGGVTLSPDVWEADIGELAGAVNPVHRSVTGNVRTEPLKARLAASLIGLPVTGPVNPPTIAYAAMTNTTTITVQAVLPSGVTAITPTSGNAANSIWRFFDQATVPNFMANQGPTGTEIAVSSWTSTTSGSVVTFTISLASAATTSGLLYHLYGTGYKSTIIDLTTVIVGNDAYGLPLSSATMGLPYGTAPANKAHSSGFSNGFS